MRRQDGIVGGSSILVLALLLPVVFDAPAAVGGSAAYAIGDLPGESGDPPDDEEARALARIGAGFERRAELRVPGCEADLASHVPPHPDPRAPPGA